MIMNFNRNKCKEKKSGKSAEQIVNKLLKYFLVTILFVPNSIHTTYTYKKNTIVKINHFELKISY